MKRIGIFALCLAALIWTGGCGTARRSEPIIGPVALDAELRRGREAFMQHCNECHPGGESGLGPAINNKSLPEALIKFQARHGLGAMPVITEHHLSDEELDAVAAYLVALRGAD